MLRKAGFLFRCSPNPEYGTLAAGPSAGLRYIQKVTTSDHRLVEYNYFDEHDLPVSMASQSARLSSIAANGQTWQYLYVRVPESLPLGTHRYQLTEVVRPDGLTWQYRYNPKYLDGSAGTYAVNQVIYPYGGQVDYAYQKVRFYAGDPYETIAIASKTTSGPAIAGGTWTYQFAPGSYLVPETNRYQDITTIVGPKAVHKYYHYGHTYVQNAINGLWLIGLMYEHGVYAEAGTLLARENNGWDKRRISGEAYRHGNKWDLAYDDAAYAPVPTSRYTERDGFGYRTDYGNLDAYGNPGTVTAYSSLLDDPPKVTDITYLTDPVRWIIGRPEHETIEGEGTIDRSFQPTTGDLLSESKYGVVTTYTYTPEGDRATVTDARGNITRYSDFYRGIARLETRPELVTIRRTVNDSGTVASITNGRGYTKAFSYDGLNRLTGIHYPINADVAITWLPNGKRLTRGSYEETVVLDGFGREIRIARTDKASGFSITRTIAYDELGRKTFKSYPNSAAGTSYSYDAIGRPRRIEHPDGTSRSLSYITCDGCYYDVEETNERGYATRYNYRTFGSPDADKTLVTVESPEEIITLIHRNQLNQITSLFQGLEETPGSNVILGLERDYHYNGNKFLESEDNPETGTTTYGRDALGNMTSRQVGASGITRYEYDGLNRQTLIDYPDTTPDVSFSYDANGNVVSVRNADSERTYVYDESDNLLSEAITIGSQPYTVSYAYSSLDHLAGITYPSGRMVDYAPDAFGHPTQVLPYVTQVQYHPSGQVQRMVYANGQVTDVTLTDRLWIDRIHAHGPAEAADLGYGYDTGGNVTAIANHANPAYNRTLTYDGFDRLISANGAWGTLRFSYDRFGNIQSKSLNGSGITYSFANLKLSRIDRSATNVETFTHDAYGNVASRWYYVNVGGQWLVPSTKLYGYDDAGNLREAAVQDLSLGLTLRSEFGYDGNGRRMQRTQDSGNTDFVYSKSDTLLGEYTGLDPRYGKEYIYLGTQLVASAETNRPPVSYAGPDQTVASGASVILDGSHSSDPDGTINVYRWAQAAGPAVTLNNANAAIASFVAPVVKSSTVLIFELTVTDDTGATATDTVQVTVTAGGDATPPVTTLSKMRSKVKGMVQFDFTLTVNEPATTFFRVTGQGAVTSGGANTTAWQTYSGPVHIQLSKRGTASFDYYSVDTAGNQEATRTEGLQ